MWSRRALSTQQHYYNLRRGHPDESTRRLIGPSRQEFAGLNRLFVKTTHQRFSSWVKCKWMNSPGIRAAVTDWLSWHFVLWKWLWCLLRTGKPPSSERCHCMLSSYSFPCLKNVILSYTCSVFLLFFHQSTVSFLFWEHQSERDYQRRNVALNKVTVTPACFCRSYLGPVSPQESGRVAD